MIHTFIKSRELSHNLPTRCFLYLTLYSIYSHYHSYLFISLIFSHAWEIHSFHHAIPVAFITQIRTLICHTQTANGRKTQNEQRTDLVHPNASSFMRFSRPATHVITMQWFHWLRRSRELMASSTINYHGWLWRPLRNHGDYIRHFDSERAHVR